MLKCPSTKCLNSFLSVKTLVRHLQQELRPYSYFCEKIRKISLTAVRMIQAVMFRHLDIMVGWVAVVPSKVSADKYYDH